MTEKEAIAYIENCGWSTTRLGLSRTQELLRRMGDPQKRLKFVHVTGSNGKGSTCAMLDAILRSAGYRVGLYTSPYIQDFCERMRVDGENIPGEVLAALTERVKEHAERMEDHPSQFELVTAIAMEYFVEEKCDIVVLEVGMGGALDSTNVIDCPEVAVLTNIGLDHTEYLGDTIEKIARTKAGIIKPGCHVVCYGGAPEAVKVIRETCLDKAVPMNVVDFANLEKGDMSLDGQCFTWKGEAHELALLGEYQAYNAAVALETVSALRQRGWKIPEDAVRKGLQDVTWPARMEVLNRNPLCILDGGHNPQCAEALVRSLRVLLPGEKAVFLLGVLADKDYPEMIRILMPMASSFVCLTPNSDRALTAQELAAYLRSQGAEAAAAENVPEGIRMAVKAAGEDGTVIAFGSLYLAGAIRTAREYFRIERIEMAEKCFDLDQFARCARHCAAEGVVLLKNERKALPLAEGTTVALFGRSQYNYYKSGTGSGGMVNTRYVIGVKEAIEEDGRLTLEKGLQHTYDEWIREHPFDVGQGWANEPWHQEEMPVDDALAESAAQNADAAIVLIGRTAGEDQDNRDAEGSWRLTDAEEKMIEAVSKAFPRTIVLLNTGNIIDMRWVKKYDPAAVAYIWQGGQEGGRGVLDVLMGDVNPAGRLADTIAATVADYPSATNFGSGKQNIQQEDIYVGYRYFETFAPEKVIYPFGYGISYTDFDIQTEHFSRDAEGVSISANVTNTGERPGRQVVQVYLEAPHGQLGKPVRVLAGFVKTGVILPGQSETVKIDIADRIMASYDDAGKTPYRSAWVMEAGDYILHVGANIRDTGEAGRFTLEETKCVCQLEEALAPVQPFDRMIPRRDEHGKLCQAWEPVPMAQQNAQERRARMLPQEIPQTGDQGIILKDVAEGRASMDAFIAQLSDEDLVCIVRGEGMSSPKVTPGCGGAFGGVTDRLLHFGIPVGCCSDGPSGIRMDSGKKAFSMPNGACLASTWDTALQEELYAWEGLELRKNKIDVLLGPGMNLHRHPLNGRNFEYFSEDPLLTGKCAAAQLRGLHRRNVTGTIKHFIMNTQETGRHTVEHVASERAIRELYLRGFEIAVKEGGAHAVMSTYGPVNGFYTSSNYDLLTHILRGEWGFDGIVMTDWWAKGNDEGAPGDPGNMAAMIRAQNDLYMVTGSAEDNTNHDNSAEALAAGTVTRAEYQRSAANICRFLMGKPAFGRFVGNEDALERQLAAEMDEEDLSYEKLVDCRLDADGNGEVDVSEIDTGRGKTTMVSVAIRERGIYHLQLTVRAASGLGSLAQIPLTILKDHQPAGQITLTGADTTWRTIDIDLAPGISTFFLSFYFAQAGMELGSVKISMKESLEEKIRRMLSRVEEAADIE